jgi:peptidoglycan/xylan/chitin deacetylase (PgdA/CDA1 family)
VKRLVRPLIGTIVGADIADSAVSFTYDDGPDEQDTPRILDALNETGARVTFFVLARRAERWPDLVRSALRAGHEVALHGDDHTSLPSLPPWQAYRAISRGRRRLERVLGQRVRLFRPPYGEQTPLTYAAARLAGLQVVGWSASADDWLDDTVEDLSHRAMRDLAPGGILLLHERVEPKPNGERVRPAHDRRALIEVLAGTAGERGWRIVPVSDLLARGATRRQRWFTAGES